MRNFLVLLALVFVSSVSLGSYIVQDGSVTTQKLANASVTQIKRFALGQQISTASGSFSTTSTSAVDVTNLSVTLTTTGRAVFIGMISDGGSSSYIAANSGGAQAQVEIQFKRDVSTTILDTTLYSNATGASATNLQIPCSSFFAIDIPSAASHTYKVQAFVGIGTNVAVNRCQLVAYEL